MKRDNQDIEEATRRIEADDKDYSSSEMDKINELGLNTFSFLQDSTTSPLDIVEALSTSGFLANLGLKTS